MYLGSCMMGATPLCRPASMLKPRNPGNCIVILPTGGRRGLPRSLHGIHHDAGRHQNTQKTIPHIAILCAQAGGAVYLGGCMGSTTTLAGTKFLRNSDGTSGASVSEDIATDDTCFAVFTAK